MLRLGVRQSWLCRAVFSTGVKLDPEQLASRVGKSVSGQAGKRVSKWVSGYDLGARWTAHRHLDKEQSVLHKLQLGLQELWGVNSR